MHLSLQHPEAAYVSGTTPGVVFRDLLIMGMRVSEGSDGPPGHILAFHVRTGKLQWKFHTIPQPGEFGYDTWDDPDAWTYTGGANSWAGLALDKARGLVYVPTGSATPDFYGGYRKGANLFANSLIALEAASGKYVWHFQIVHHDLWDRDLPANPNLVTLHRDGRRVDAVAQITKHGYVFVFDRSDGTPLFPIEERPVPQEALPGEKTWPTQPFPVLPEPFARQYFRPEDVYSPDSSLRQLMLEKYHQVAHRLMFTPPGKEGAWIFPGFDGGGQWGGAAFDPETQVMYVNSSELPWSQTMTEVSVNTSDHSLKAIGESIYKRDCLMCHGKNREGNLPAYPSLLGLENRFTLPQLSSVVENGRNMMPAFKHISQADRQALYTFLLQLPEKEGTEKAVEVPESKEAKPAVRYRMTGYNRFLDPLGYPGIKPPWGTLNAIDLNTGERVWQVPLGEYPELTKKGIPVTGTENYGGPVVTKGGLIFIAATKDEKMRAFDKQTGEVLWEGNLPAAGYATPSTYMAGGRQYVVIACGGGKIGSKSGDQYVAFALP